MGKAPRRWWQLRGFDLGWGDYGDVLAHGLVWNLDRTPEGCLRLERTGPFVPPATVPGNGHLLLTAEARVELERAHRWSFEFRPVVLARVVNLPWPEWDLTDEHPRKYPAGGEPENYVLRRKDSDAARRGVPEVFEVLLAEVPPDELDRATVPIVRYGGGSILVEEELRGWLDQRWGRWLELEPWTAHPS